MTKIWDFCFEKNSITEKWKTMMPQSYANKILHFSAMKYKFQNHIKLLKSY